MRRRRRRWWLIAVIVLVAAAATVAGFLVFGRGKAQTVRYLTSTATKGTIARTVQADFTLASARSSTSLSVAQSSSTSSSQSSGSSTTQSSSSSATGSSSSSSSGSTVSSSQSGVVTSLTLAVGATPHTLEQLLSVSGVPLYAFVSTTPLYENLSVSLASGVDNTNVEALQRALKAGGYYTGAVDGDFGSGTQIALEDWQAAKGLTQTGKVDITKFVWVPTGAVLSAWQVGLGSQLSGNTTLATVGFPRQLVAQAPISQADIGSLKVGQTAVLTIDGDTADPMTGTITFIDTQPASSSSAGSSSSTAEYTVTFKLTKLPAIARSGMTGTVVVTLAKRTNVLLVPTSAVVGTSASPYVRVMVDGKPVYRQVTTGMTTSSVTQISSGLAAGEVVMTGTYSSSSSSASSNSGGFGFPGIGGGTFRQRTSTSTGRSTTSGGGP